MVFCFCFSNLSTYFWLCWVFVAASTLCLVAAIGGSRSCCRAQALGVRAQYLWCMDLVALRHGRPSQTGDRTRVLCTGKQILYPSTSREVRNCFSLPTLSSTVNGTDSEQSEKPGEVLRPHVSQKKLSCPSPGSSPQPQDFPSSPGGSSRFTAIRHLHIHPGMRIECECELLLPATSMVAPS